MRSFLMNCFVLAQVCSYCLPGTGKDWRLWSTGSQGLYLVVVRTVCTRTCLSTSLSISMNKQAYLYHCVDLKSTAPEASQTGTGILYGSVLVAVLVATARPSPVIPGTWYQVHRWRAETACICMCTKLHFVREPKHVHMILPLHNPVVSGLHSRLKGRVDTRDQVRSQRQARVHTIIHALLL